MELQGAGYLYTLASLGLAFVAFSVIVVVFRQMLGADMSNFQLMLVRFFIENGFSVTAFALLPPLMGLLGFSPPMIWRMASGIVATYMVIYLVMYLRRRRIFKQGPLPLRIYINYIITSITIIALWLNVIGKPFAPNIGPYALGLFWALIQGFLVFVETLGIFFEGPGTEQ